jgi:arsenical pump membrane protein
VAERDGLFGAAGSALGDLPLPPATLFVTSLTLVAATTTVLNLDTSVFFLTPILLHLARSRGLDEQPFLYGAVFMSNAASLYLPGSNLTNLIVLHGEHVSGGTFFVRTWAAALAATVSTAVVLLVLFRRVLRAEREVAYERPRVRGAVGPAAVIVATVLVLVLSAPALPVLITGAIAAVVSRTPWQRIANAVDVRVLGGLFVLAVALGTLGRQWNGPHALLDSTGRIGSATIGAVASVLVNNLPASVLLTPQPPQHARALLIGLNLGPNLAVTGSLSAFLWLRAARAAGGRPSVRTYSLYGLAVVPVSVAAALSALAL